MNRRESYNNRRRSSQRRRISAARRKRRRQLRRRIGVALGLVLISVLMIQFGKKFFAAREVSQVSDEEAMLWAGAPEIQVALLDVNEYSRPGIALEEVKGIVMHYTANPGSSAMANRDYFNNLQTTHTTKASSHFVIGLEGEVVQCIPSSEISYASNDRNKDTISIECCHPDESGMFNDETYQSMVQLAGWLCVRFHLSSDDIIRHYDVTGKICPKYFVENEEAWNNFRQDVDKKIKEIEQM